jgi:beta-lactamase class D
LDKATGKYLAWYVGFVETTSLAGEKNVYYFALNLDGTTFAMVRDRRVILTKQLLQALDIVPAQ